MYDLPPRRQRARGVLPRGTAGPPIWKHELISRRLLLRQAMAQQQSKEESGPKPFEEQEDESSDKAVGH